MKYLASTAALIILCSVFSAQAQYRRVDYFPDSIQVDFPEQNAIVIFETKRLQDNFQFIENFSSLLTDLVAYVKRGSITNAPQPKRVDVNVKSKSEKQAITNSTGNKYESQNEKMEITVTDLIPQTHMIIRQNTIEQLLPPGWEVYINTNDVKVTIYAQDFEGMESLAQKDYAQIVSALKADPKLKMAKRNSVQARLIMKEGKIDKSKINYIHPLDLIYIAGSAGVGLFREKVYPELSVSLGILFKDHFNRRNHKVELIYSAMYFTKISENEMDLNISPFLSLAYGKNFGHSDRDQWTTIGAGLLLYNDQSSNFQGTTMKFFLSTDIGSSKINIVPQFYLTDGLSKFAYGLSLNYTF